MHQGVERIYLKLRNTSDNIRVMVIGHAAVNIRYNSISSSYLLPAWTHFVNGTVIHQNRKADYKIVNPPKHKVT